MSKTKILIVDDHNVVTEGIKSTLGSLPEIQVVGEAANGVQAIEMVNELDPDIVIMDISMPDLNGLEATKQIKKLYPDVRVIIFSVNSRKEFVIDLFKAGISGYVLKQDPISDLVLAIEAVRAGGTFFSKMAPNILLTHLNELEERDGKKSDYEALSPREREVFLLLADGNTIHDISDKLYISKKTVESHKYNIMKKLKAKTLSDLTKTAVRRGLIEP